MLSTIPCANTINIPRVILNGTAENTLFEIALRGWSQDTSIQGNKDQAASKILAAYYNQSSELDLSCLALTSLPYCIGLLKNLKKLTLFLNKFDSLPDSIKNLQNLEILDLNLNEFSLFPEDIISLVNLKTLDLSHNQLECLSENIGNLNNLEELDISFNEISAISNSTYNLNNLKKLNSSHNELQNLSDIGSSLNNLEELDVSYNEISIIPNFICTLTKLKKLNFSHNKLSLLPDDIGKLKHLEILNLSNNSLSAYPDSFGDLEMLRDLDISSTIPINYTNPNDKNRIRHYFPDSIDKKNHGNYSDIVHIAFFTFLSFMDARKNTTQKNTLHFAYIQYPISPATEEIVNKLNNSDRIHIASLECMNTLFELYKGNMDYENKNNSLCDINTLQNSFKITSDQWQYYSTMSDYTEYSAYMSNLGDIFSQNTLDKLFKGRRRNRNRITQSISLNMNTKVYNQKLRNIPFTSLLSFSDAGDIQEALNQLTILKNDPLSIPDSFSKLNNLRYLNISNNCFTIIPKNIFAPRNLEQLKISQCMGVSFPNELNSDSKIKKLDLSNSIFKFYPQIINNLSSLKELNIKDASFITDPNPILPSNKQIKVINSSPEFSVYPICTDKRKYL